MASSTRLHDIKTDTLDVEDEDRRQARIQNLLENLGDSIAAPAPNSDLQLQSMLNGRLAGGLDIGGPRALEGPNALLARLEAFLPQLAESNAELLTRAQANPESVDIENVGEEDGEYIEMNLGLGVFEERRRTAGEDASSSSDSSESDSSSDDFLSSSSSSSDASDGEVVPNPADADGSGRPRVHRPTKPLPLRARSRNASHTQARPEIVILAESSAPTDAMIEGTVKESPS